MGFKINIHIINFEYVIVHWNVTKLFMVNKKKNRTTVNELGLVFLL